MPVEWFNDWLNQVRKLGSQNGGPDACQNAVIDGHWIFREFEMQIGVILSLTGAGVAGMAFAWRRQWAMSIAWLFSFAYTLFDKLFPSALPEPIVTSFSFVFLALVLLFCWQSFSRKRVV